MLDEEKMREAFESYARRCLNKFGAPLYTDLTKDENGDYQKVYANHAWAAWKASLATLPAMTRQGLIGAAKSTYSCCECGNYDVEDSVDEIIELMPHIVRKP